MCACWTCVALSGATLSAHTCSSLLKGKHTWEASTQTHAHAAIFANILIHTSRHTLWPQCWWHTIHSFKPFTLTKLETIYTFWSVKVIYFIHDLGVFGRGAINGKILFLKIGAYVWYCSEMHEDHMTWMWRSHDMHRIHILLYSAPAINN